MFMQLIGAPYLSSSKCIAYLKEKQRQNWSHPHASFNNIAFIEHHFRPTFNKHAGEISRGIRLIPTFQLSYFTDETEVKDKRDSEGHLEEANVFALGMHFLFYVISRHASAFQWRDPKQGYEYNFQVGSIVKLILPPPAFDLAARKGPAAVAHPRAREVVGSV